MEKLCFTLATRQRTCQNGVARNIDNVYTNISPGSSVPLSFGYTVTFISGNSSKATIQISNPNNIPSLVFNIPIGGFKVFDLPTESGTLRVLIGVTADQCCDTTVCCCPAGG